MTDSTTKQLRVYKYYVRPVDVASESAAVLECDEYSRLREAYRRVQDRFFYRWVNARTRKLYKVPRELCPLDEDMRRTVDEARATTDGRRQRAAQRASDLGLALLGANRAIYSTRRCSYETARLAQQAGEQSVRQLDIWQWLEGRAAILVERAALDGSILSIQTDRSGSKLGNTQWSIHRDELERRPFNVGQVVRMHLQRERRTTTCRTRSRFRWYLHVTLAVDAGTRPVDKDRCAAGLDLCWRSTGKHTLRVAYVHDERGRHEPINMPARAFSRTAHANGMQSISDREIADPLRAKLKLHPRACYGVVIANVGADDPRSRRLVHLSDWYTGAKRNAIAARDQAYVLAIQSLCRRYHTIYVEGIKGVPALVARAKTRRKNGLERKDAEATEGAKRRDSRQLAASFTGFLRRLQADAAKYGTAVEVVDMAYTSRECADGATLPAPDMACMCGHDMGNPGAACERRCDACGRSWDIDDLAAVNLLVRGTARIPTSEAAE